MKRLRRVTLISFIGLLLSFGLWWVSFWNFDYCLKSPYRISLNHGSVSWSDWSFYEQDRKWPAGVRKIGYNGLTTLWKPYFFRRSGNLVVTIVPLWMAVGVFAMLYYGLSLAGVGWGLLRQRRGRCRECGRRLADTLLCCRSCQTPASMMTVGRRALGQFALHGFVLAVGAAVVSYFPFSATPTAGKSIGLTRGALSIGWGSNARPSMSLAGYVGMNTIWLPSKTSSIANAAAPLSLPPTPVIGNGAPIPVTPPSVFQSPPSSNPTADEVKELLSQLSTGEPQIEGPVDRDVQLEVISKMLDQLARDRVVRTQPALAAPVPPAVAVLPARTFLFPLWVPLVVFGYATWRLRFAPANLLRRRRKLGLCLRGGYDLRASLVRCPECGGEFESSGA